MKYSALDVAKLFISFSQPEFGELVSNLKLQKWLYYAQGLHYALYDKPLFKEDIVAWQYGPVVKEVFEEYSEYKFAIPYSEEMKHKADQIFNEETIHFIHDVYEVMNQYSALYLMVMSKNELPYRNTKIRDKISKKDLKKEFEKWIQ